MIKKQFTEEELSILRRNPAANSFSHIEVRSFGVSLLFPENSVYGGSGQDRPEPSSQLL